MALKAESSRKAIPWQRAKTSRRWHKNQTDRKWRRVARACEDAWAESYLDVMLEHFLEPAAPDRRPTRGWVD